MKSIKIKEKKRSDRIIWIDQYGERVPTNDERAIREITQQKYFNGMEHEVRRIDALS